MSVCLNECVKETFHGHWLCAAPPGPSQPNATSLNDDVAAEFKK